MISLLLATKVIAIVWVTITSLGTGALYLSGHMSPHEHWSDKAVSDPTFYREKLDYLADREMGRFIFDPELRQVTLDNLVISRSSNSTNGTDPIGPVALGECATDKDCNDHGDCIISDGYGHCDCNDWYTTEDDDDPCAYRRKGRWGTFMLMWFHTAAAYGYLSEGQTSYILIAVFAFLSPIFMLIGLYCLVVPGVVIAVAIATWVIYNLIAAGMGQGLPGHDGLGHGTAKTMFF